MMENWKDLLDRGWRFNSDVIRSFDVPKYEFDRFRNRVKKSNPNFYRNNVYKCEDRRLLLSPRMVEIMRDIYDSYRWRSKNVSDNDISIVLNKLDDGNNKKFKQESFYNIDFNGEDYKTMLSIINEKIVDLDGEIDILNDYISNLLEFRDKVAYLSKN